MQMQDQINEGHQIRIIIQIEGVPIESEEMLTTIQDLDSWFKEYGF